MREGISLQTRRALLQHMLPQYREASTVKKKSKLLDAFTAATGYNRKYAMGLLNHAKVEQSTPQRPRPRHYGPEVQHALFLVWHAANRICAKRLIPFLPILIESLERHKHLFEVAQALDPIRLFRQLEQLQQAVFRCAVNCSPVISPIPSAPIRVFSVDEIVQWENFLKRGVSAIRQQDSRPCTESRSGENGSWAGGAPTKTLLKGSGNRSSPG